MRISAFAKFLTAPFAAGVLVGAAATAGAATMLGSDVFSDVPRGSYYDAAVGEMYAAGVVKGNPDGTFRPGDYVTRADVAVMMQRLRDDLTGNVSSRSSSRSSSRTSSSSSSSSTSSASSTSYNPKGTIRFTTAEYRVPENVSTKKITIAVVRTGGNDGTVTVDYTMSGGSATEGEDYVKASGTLTFANKETSKTFDVQIKDDSLSEGNENVTITLSNPGNGVSLGTPSSANLIITDDESGSSSSTTSSSSSSSSSGPTFGFSATQYSVNENASTLTITVVRNGSTSGTASVNYATSNGSGKSGSEYTQASGTLSFANGESSKTFAVSIFNDNESDGAKTFNVSLSSPTNASLAANLSTALVTINDDETIEFGSGSFKFSKSTYQVTETSGQAVITVQRTGGSSFPATVGYATSPITASPGSDFTHVSGTLSFSAGEAAKIFIVPILSDTVADTGETFSVELLNPSNNVPLISPYSATVSIE